MVKRMEWRKNGELDIMIDCESIANEIKSGIKKEITDKKIQPKLAIIQVGNNQASNKYVKSKLNTCSEVGIKGIIYKFNEDIEQSYICSLISELNYDDNINGIIVQLPLPKHLNEHAITNLIAIEKDVDGFKYDSPFIPCTPRGILTILNSMNIDLKGKEITLVGYGKLVNKPLMNLLSDKGATVTVCRSHTSEEKLYKHCRQSDIIITAVGKNGIINKYCFNRPFKNFDQPIVIDCGIEILKTVDKNGNIKYKQFGDCDVDLYDHIDNITPRIKGTGIMTVASLMENVMEAYNIIHG